MTLVFTICLITMSNQRMCNEGSMFLEHETTEVGCMATAQRVIEEFIIAKHSLDAEGWRVDHWKCTGGKI